MSYVHVIDVRNVNGALKSGLLLMQEGEALTSPSRNGKVTRWPGPVITVTRRPMERVLFNPLRNANPFFHALESLWMLAGANELPWLAQFNKRMATFSDDGGLTQPGAYGYRWREYFGYDQLECIVDELLRDPTSRRAVLTMWDGGADRDNSIMVPVRVGGDLASAAIGSKDVPCNTQVYFGIRQGKLDMAVTCRSNDLLWGAHGANAVHFSVLHEYIAARIGTPVGVMTQFSFNYHLYDGVLKYPINDVVRATADLYGEGVVNETPIFADYEQDRWERALPDFMEWAGPTTTGRDTPPATGVQFLDKWAVPMVRAWDYKKKHMHHEAMDVIMKHMPQSDWRHACWTWLAHDLSKYVAKKAPEVSRDPI